MKYNNTSSNNNNNNSNNKNNTSDCGMNEIDTETPVVWPSWCYAGKCITYFFCRYFLLIFLLIKLILSVFANANFGHQINKNRLALNNSFCEKKSNTFVDCNRFNSKAMTLNELKANKNISKNHTNSENIKIHMTFFAKPFSPGDKPLIKNITFYMKLNFKLIILHSVYSTIIK